MPGRREGGHDFCLMPMSFREYVRMMTGLTIGSPNVSDVISSEAAFANFRMRCLEEESRIRSCLDHYLLSGGIPRIVAEIKRSKEVGVDATNTYLSAISSEIEKQKRSTAILRAVLTGVYETMASPVSYTRLAQTQHLSGPATARDHLDLLHASFICFAVAPLDISHKTVFPKKDRKYYFSDPIYTMAIQRAFSLPSPAIGAYAEAAVGCWLMRRFAPTWAHWGHVDSLYYWKSSSGHEVDFVLDVDGAYRGIEVKYQTAVSGWDEQSLKRGIGRGILATRNDFAFGDIPRIPLWALLLTFA
jgi:predicted AAA+ superfamily ATPase